MNLLYPTLYTAGLSEGSSGERAGHISSSAHWDCEWGQFSQNFQAGTNLRQSPPKPG